MASIEFPWLKIQKINYLINSDLLISKLLFLVHGCDKSVCRAGNKWPIAAKSCGALVRMASV
jgi:hypothetical protein